MADTKYTIVGMSSTGKTCYLTAMYKEMATGFDGFTLWTNDATRAKFERDILTLRDRTVGIERFPAATVNTEDATKSYEFRLIYNKRDIISFEILDYAGGSLIDRGPVYTQIKQSIAESTAMYVFIDGKSLCEEDRQERKDNVYYDCAMTIAPLIQDFADAHDGFLPPIVFVITKSDLCKAYVSENEIVQIIRDLFSPAFSDGTRSYICAVSLGNSISDNNYKGRFDPVNIHIPFFIGSYHEYYNRCLLLKSNIEKANKDLNSDRDDFQSALAKEQRKWSVFRNKKLVASCLESIKKTEGDIQSNQTTLDGIRALCIRFGAQLEMDSKNFKCFIDGVEQPAFKALQF